jgi:hypothetical protein
MNFLKISTIILTILSFKCASISVGAILVIRIPMYLNYSLANFIIFGIPWITIFAIYAYKGSMSAYYFSGYFSIICYYFKQCLTSIRKRLEIIIKRMMRNQKISWISQLLEKHNGLCEQIHCYNKYWKKYLTINYSIFLLLFAFILCSY